MANIFSRLLGAGSLEARSAEPAETRLEPAVSIEPVTAPEVRSETSTPVSVADPVIGNLFALGSSSDAALNTSTAARAVSLISSAYGSADVTLYRLAADGSPVPATDHNLYHLLMSGTSELSAFELKSQMMRSLLSWGEAFALMDFGSDGQIVNITPLDFQNVGVEILGNGRIQYRVSDPLRNYKQDVYSSNQIFHAKHAPLNGRGRSPLSLAALSMGIASDYERSISADARIGFKAGGVLSAPGAISDETASRLKTSLENGYMGRQGAGKIVVVGDGMSFTRMNFSSADMQTLEHRKFNSYAVAQAFGTPPDSVGLVFESSWNSAAEQSRQAVAVCFEPWSQSLNQQLAAYALGSRERRKLYIGVDWSALISGSLKDKATAYNSLAASGIMTINEIRALGFDLKPLAGGDALRLPLNTAKAVTADAGPEPVGADA